MRKRTPGRRAYAREEFSSEAPWLSGIGITGAGGYYSNSGFMKADRKVSQN
jgi:hypothetical protein